MSVVDTTIVPASKFESAGQDHYISHLVEVNRSNQVTSTADIVNAKGVLLLRKGSRIDEDAAAVRAYRLGAAVTCRVFHRGLRVRC